MSKKDIKAGQIWITTDGDGRTGYLLVTSVLPDNVLEYMNVHPYPIKVDSKHFKSHAKLTEYDLPEIMALLLTRL